MPGFQVANLIRDRQLLEAAKREAAAVLAGPNEEVSKEEIDRALRHMRTHWQKTYGLIEVGLWCVSVARAPSPAVFDADGRRVGQH